jgi:hypothetical protein
MARNDKMTANRIANNKYRDISRSSDPQVYSSLNSSSSGMLPHPNKFPRNAFSSVNTTCPKDLGKRPDSLFTSRNILDEFLNNGADSTPWYSPVSLL